MLHVGPEVTSVELTNTQHCPPPRSVYVPSDQNKSPIASVHSQADRLASVFGEDTSGLADSLTPPGNSLSHLVYPPYPQVLHHHCQVGPSVVALHETMLGRSPPSTSTVCCGEPLLVSSSVPAGSCRPGR